VTLLYLGQLAASSESTPIELSRALSRTSSLLASAREVALSRHELADLVATLLGQLDEPIESTLFTKTEGAGSTLLNAAEQLLVALEESELGEEYLQVVETLLTLR
jgi:hypothetical protein